MTSSHWTCSALLFFCAACPTSSTSSSSSSSSGGATSSSSTGSSSSAGSSSSSPSASRAASTSSSASSASTSSGASSSSTGTGSSAVVTSSSSAAATSSSGISTASSGCATTCGAHQACNPANHQCECIPAGNCTTAAVDQRFCAGATTYQVCSNDGTCPFLAPAQDCATGAPLATCVVQGDGAGACVSPTLQLTLARDVSTSPSPVDATATVVNADGTPGTGRAVTITAQGTVTVGTTVDHGDGTYTARITPQQPSGEVPITATLTAGTASIHVDRVALVLPLVGAAWGQPESIRGSVNTAGYEDGASVSPDGEWLLITDYSPIDGICCLAGCSGTTPGDVGNPYCQTVLGPYAAPLRPDFPGADRIVDATHIINKCPKHCFTSDFTATGGEITSIALPPVGAYIFHRQPDGSFAEPHFLGLDADGCSTPTGYSFASTPSGNAAELIYNWSEPFTSGGAVYWTPITLGATNVLGHYACTGPGVVTVTGKTYSVLPNFTLGHANTNAVFKAGFLMWDEESATPNHMYLAQATGTLPNATFSPAAPPFSVIPVGNPADDHSQPFFDPPSQTLVFTSNGSIVTSLLTGADPFMAASWAAVLPALTSEPSTARAGSIISLGQGTVASRPGARGEMYFVYALWTGTGFNIQIGMVPRL